MVERYFSKYGNQKVLTQIALFLVCWNLIRMERSPSRQRFLRKDLETDHPASFNSTRRLI